MIDNLTGSLILNSNREDLSGAMARPFAAESAHQSKVYLSRESQQAFSHRDFSEDNSHLSELLIVSSPKMSFLH